MCLHTCPFYVYTYMSIVTACVHFDWCVYTHACTFACAPECVLSVHVYICSVYRYVTFVHVWIPSIHECALSTCVYCLCMYVLSVPMDVFTVNMCALYAYMCPLYTCGYPVCNVCANCVCLFSVHVSALSGCVYTLLICVCNMCMSVPFVNVWVSSMHICVLRSLCVRISGCVLSEHMCVLYAHMCSLCMCICGSDRNV